MPNYFKMTSKTETPLFEKSPRICRRNISNMPVRQRGLTTLAITFVLLIGVTLMTINSSKLGVLELSVSTGYENQQVAFNNAESGGDAVFAIIRNIVDLNKPIGYKKCTPDDNLLLAEGACDSNSISTINGWPYTSSEHQASVVYEKKGCAPRSLDTSCTHVQFTHYEVTSAYDDTQNDASRSEVTVGLMELVPAF
jgi:hypothetical protein